MGTYTTEVVLNGQPDPVTGIEQVGSNRSRTYLDSDNFFQPNAGSIISGDRINFTFALGSSAVLNGHGDGGIVSFTRSVLQAGFNGGSSGYQWRLRNGTFRCTDGTLRFLLNSTSQANVIQVRNSMALILTNTLIEFFNSNLNSGRPVSTPGLDFSSDGNYDDVTIINPQTGEQEAVRSDVSGATIGAWINMPKFMSGIGLDFTLIPKRAGGLYEGTYSLRVNTTPPADSNGMWLVGQNWSNSGTDGTSSGTTHNDFSGTVESYDNGIFLNNQDHQNLPVLFIDPILNSDNGELPIKYNSATTNIVFRVGQSIRPRLRNSDGDVADQKLRVADTTKRLLIAPSQTLDATTDDFTNYQDLTDGFAPAENGYFHLNATDDVSLTTGHASGQTRVSVDDISSDTFYWISYTDKPPLLSSWEDTFRVEPVVANRVDLNTASDRFGLPLALNTKEAVVDDYVQGVAKPDPSTAVTDLNSAYRQLKARIYDNSRNFGLYAIGTGSVLAYRDTVTRLNISSSVAEADIASVSNDNGSPTIGIRTGASLGVSSTEAGRLSALSVSDTVGEIYLGTAGVALALNNISITAYLIRVIGNLTFNNVNINSDITTTLALTFTGGSLTGSIIAYPADEALVLDGTDASSLTLPEGDNNTLILRNGAVEPTTIPAGWIIPYTVDVDGESGGLLSVYVDGTLQTAGTTSINTPDAGAVIEVVYTNPGRTDFYASYTAIAGVNHTITVATGLSAYPGIGSALAASNFEILAHTGTGSAATSNIRVTSTESSDGIVNKALNEQVKGTQNYNNLIQETKLVDIIGSDGVASTAFAIGANVTFTSNNPVTIGYIRETSGDQELLSDTTTLDLLGGGTVDVGVTISTPSNFDPAITQSQITTALNEVNVNTDLEAQRVIDLVNANTNLRTGI